MADKDPPIEPQTFLGGVTVVDIGDVRVARGLSRRPHISCRHNAMVYDRNERRIWCKDCETNIDAFDAFEIIVGQFSTEARRLGRLNDEIQEARDHALISIAAKKMDVAWRKRHLVPACPHCRVAILPGDVERMPTLSRAIEEQRRKRAGANKGAVDHG